MKVYVISSEGHPLMPCEPVIARLLLKSKRAKVVRREPFTIKLSYETTSYVQKLTLGVDTGSGTIGTAVADEEGNVLYMSEVQVRNDISKKMIQRAKYRRNRRNRKTRYRKARWMNRKNSIRKDRFSPTMASKLHSHVKEIEYIKSILPIMKIVLETGQFHTHLMKCLFTPLYKAEIETIYLKSFIVSVSLKLLYLKYLSEKVLEKVERYCPLCDKVHLAEKRKRISEMLIKNEVISYEEVYFFCPESIDYEEDEFVSAGLMNQNLRNARNAYRKKHNASHL